MVESCYRWTVQISLRPAVAQDFEYCQQLYFDGMAGTIKELKLDHDKQAAGLREQWSTAQVRIITLDGSDVGWLQCKQQDGTLFVAQLFVAEPFQRQGIGTQALKRLIGEASAANSAVTLAVVKSNPAARLYERLGFRITHEDDRKFYMRRDADCAGPETIPA